MADNKNQDCEMNGEDFSQDVSASNENGGSAGTNGNDTNARDDDRYLIKLLVIYILCGRGVNRRILWSKIRISFHGGLRKNRRDWDILYLNN